MRVALVVNRLEDYALPLVTGLAAALRDRGSSLLVLAHPAVQTGAEPWLGRLVDAGVVEAVVLTSVVDAVSGTSAVTDLVTQARGVPVVTMGVAGHGAPDVSCDNASAAKAAAQHLLAGGRRRALLVAGPADNTDSTERERAFTTAFTAPVMAMTRKPQGAAPEGGGESPDGAGPAAGSVQVVRGDFSREVAYRRVVELLHRDEGQAGVCIDAVFAANDEMGLGTLDALAVCGLRCPEDVAVVGFDNTDAAALARPALTSVDQQLQEQGRRAAALLFAQHAGDTVPDRVRTATQLVVRASSTQTGPSTAASSEEVGLLRAGRVELFATRQLLSLHHGLLNAADEADLSCELSALLPRTGVKRMFLARSSADTTELIYAWGAQGASPDQRRYRSENLLPETLLAELDSGVLVVHLLQRGDQELGVLLYEQEVLDRWTGQALQQGLASTLAVMARTHELAAHAAELESLVLARTAQLSAEVTTRRAAQEQLQRANSGLRAALLVDGLTGVLNRRAFEESLHEAWDAHELTGQPVSVLMCDVDLFKRYNDAAGHLAGDSCLRAVASCISEAVRGRDDVVARYGGEEFAVILPGTDAAGAAAVAERVLRRVRAAGLPHPGCEPGTTVSLSVGVATSSSPASTRTRHDIVGRADEALYRAKAEGRDRAVTALACTSPASR